MSSNPGPELDKTEPQCPVCEGHVFDYLAERGRCDCSIKDIRAWAAGSGRTIGDKFEAKEYINERNLLRGEALWEARQRRR